MIVANFYILWRWLFCDFSVPFVSLFIIVKVNEFIFMDNLLSEYFLHLRPVFIQTLQVQISIGLFFIQASGYSSSRMRAAFIVSDGVLL